MHSNKIPGISEKDFLFLTRPEWVIKKQLREISKVNQMKFYWCYFRYYRKALSIEKEIEILRKHLDEKTIVFVKNKLARIDEKFISNVKKYIERTREILNIKD